MNSTRWNYTNVENIRYNHDHYIIITKHKAIVTVLNEFTSIIMWQQPDYYRARPTYLPLTPLDRFPVNRY